jgi:hypothetical protein
MKRKFQINYPCVSAVPEKSQFVCGVNLDMNRITISFTIRLAYKVIRPMITFKNFRHLISIRFFGI